MAQQNQTFKLNTSNYIGFEYKQYLNQMKLVALTNPKDYATFRNNAIKDLADKLSKDWYDMTYDILTTGKHGNINLGLPANPNYPAQELAKLALSHTQTIVDMMDEIVELLVPEDYLATAVKRLEDKRETNGIITTSTLGVKP